MVTWTGTLEQLLWFDGLARRQKNHICSALATNRFKLLWNSQELCGTLVTID